MDHGDLMRMNAGRCEDKPAMLGTGFGLSCRELDEWADQVARVAGLGPEDRFMCVLPVDDSFKLAACVLLPVRLGAAAVVVDRFSPDGVLTAIEEHRVSVFPGTAEMFSAILRHIQTPEAYDLSAWRVCLLFGERMPAGEAERFRSVFGVPVLELEQVPARLPGGR